MALSTSTLNHLMRTDRLPQYKGAHPIDYLPKAPVPKPAAMIVNTDPHDKPGKHWVAIYIDIDGSADYFCSYGYGPRKLIQQFLQCNAQGGWRQNTQRVQGLLSTTCGHYCVYFLMYRCRGVPMNVILEHFDKKDYACNDEMVVQFVNRYFAMDHKVLDVAFLLNQMCKAE